MEEWKIYHNPNCSKSRRALEILEEKGIEPEIIEYLNEPLNEKDLRELLSSLGVEASAIVRTNETAYVEQAFDLNDENTVLEALVYAPELLQRPIVMRGKKAVIGRPPETIKKLF